jgi:sigma-B regulation protein RsbU (phosphoserine phosphatase)
MVTAELPALSPAVWRELFALAKSEAGERAFLDRVVELWRAARGAEVAALYVEHEGEYRREAQAGPKAGAVRLPEVLAGGEPPPGCAALPLPGGLLLARPAAGAPAPGADPLALLLAGGAKLRRVERLLKEKHFQANYRGVELEALYDVGLAIASTLDLDRLAEEILLRAAALLDARRGALYLVEAEGFRLKHTFGGEAAPELPAGALEACLAGEGEAPPELLAGARHLLVVPIESDGHCRGVLLVGDKESRSGVGPFPDRDRRTLALFANQAAIALENARLHRQALEQERLEREMELAAEIQRQILPDRVPELRGFELVGWNRPARQVGGDYYGIHPVAPERLALALGDVSGKGVPAALLVSTLHSALTLLRDRARLGPELLDRLNRHIFDSSSSNKFITLFLAELALDAGELVYVNAGHNPGLLLRSDGAVERLAATGLPLGLVPGAAYQARAVVLAPGDLVCLYSDGITEAASAAEEEFGEGRLVEVLTALRRAPLAEAVAAIDRAGRDFAGDLPQGDDQTLILLRRAPS